MLTIALRGVNSPPEIADRAVVPRSKVYEVLEILEEKKIIQVQNGKYIVVPSEIKYIRMKYEKNSNEFRKLLRYVENYANRPRFERYNYHKIDVIICAMKTKVYFPPIRYLLFVIILLSFLLLSALVNNNRISASTTTLEPKHFLTVEKPILGFKISYPYNWNITDNDFVISFKAPSNTAFVTFTITNLTSYSKSNLTLEQYSSNKINTIKSVQSKKIGNSFELVESKPYLLSGQPGHEIAFLNGTKVDAIHNYTKTLLVWSIVDGKIYYIRYTAQASEYSNYIQTVFYIIDSFRLL